MIMAHIHIIWIFIANFITEIIKICSEYFFSTDLANVVYL